MSMSAAAKELSRHHAGLIEHYEERTDDGAQLLLSGFSGPAGAAARRSLRESAELLLSPATQMEAVARALSEYGALQDRINLLLHRHGWMASQAGLAPIVDQLRGLGQALDWMCARSIDALCTPLLPDPPSRLADFEDLHLDSIQDINSALASPAVTDLAAQHPDAFLMEVGEGRLVALVDPHGVATAPQRADVVTTFVPGVGSSNPETWGESLNRAREMARSTGGPVVAWMGYRAPDNVTRAVHTAPAAHAGAELRAFQQALGQHFPGARQMVVGYSYGSTVVGSRRVMAIYLRTRSSSWAAPALGSTKQVNSTYRTARESTP